MKEGYNVIFVPGDPNQACTSIALDERPYPSHCWIRAAGHIYRMMDIEYFLRVESAKTCQAISEAIAAKMKAPQRVEPRPGFSWTSFKTITPIR